MTRAARTVIWLALLVFAACGRDPEVVVHTSVSEHAARPVFEQFERETGVRVRAVYVSSGAGAEACAAALRGDSLQPRADVYWARDASGVLAVASMLAPGGAAGAAPWHGVVGRWADHVGCARVVVYAPDRVPVPPERWTDILDAHWRGRIAMADPRSGSTCMHFGAMKVYWDANAMPGYFEAWAEGLADNAPFVVSGDGAGVAEAVATGRADIGMTDTEDVLSARARGLELAVAYPRHARDARHPGGGTLHIPTAIGVLAGAPNPEQAAAFMAYMVVGGGAQRKTPGPGAPSTGSASGSDHAVHNPLDVDPVAAAHAADAAAAVFVQFQRNHAGAPPADSRAKGGE